MNRAPRIYHAGSLTLGQEVELAADAANHVARVLRLGEGAPLILFTGDQHIYPAVITQSNKRTVLVRVTAQQASQNESPLIIHLAQGISRGERMDFVLQKSVELGVHSITPLFTERCTVKLQGERLEKRIEQWQRIVISACEQSGRNFIPQVRPALTLNAWLEQAAQGQRLMLEPRATKTFKTLSQHTAFELLIGPEGGFSPQEQAQCLQQNCLGLQLGPRILRTETAALAAITALQYQFGDLAGPHSV